MKTAIQRLSLEKDGGQKQPRIPRDTQKSNNSVNIPKRERERAFPFQQHSFIAFSCFFSEERREVGEGSETM